MPPSPQGTKGIKGHLLVEAAMRRSRDTNSARARQDGGQTNGACARQDGFGCWISTVILHRQSK